MLKKIIISCFILQVSHAVEFSVLTQNILGPHTQDVEGFGYKRGDYGRIDEMVGKAAQVQPTFLCFQEWDSQTWSKLSQPTKDLVIKHYELIAVQPKGQNGGVALYKKRDSKIATVMKKSLELSNAKFPGACAYGVFDINGDNVLVASLHISRANYRSGKNDGEQQLNDLVSDLKNLIVQQKCSVILAGDINTFYEEVVSDTIQYLASKGLPVAMYDHDSWTVNDKDGNFAAIDHVLYSPNLKLNVAKSWVGAPTNPYTDQQASKVQAKIKVPKPLIHQSGYNSDHLPILVTFDLKVVQGEKGAPAPQGNVKEIDFAQWFTKNEQWIMQNMNMIVSTEFDLGIELGDDLLFWVPEGSMPFGVSLQWENQLRAKLDELLDKRKNEIRVVTHKEDPLLVMQALELATRLKL